MGVAKRLNLLAALPDHFTSHGYRTPFGLPD